MIAEGINAFRNKRILLLQGPLGPFFRRLASDLEGVGAEVFKVNFNGGDWLFYPSKSINYRGGIEDWPEFFERLFVKAEDPAMVRKDVEGLCKKFPLPYK